MARRCYRGDEGSSTVFLSKTTIHSVPEKNQGPFKPHDSHASPIEVTKPSQTKSPNRIVSLLSHGPRCWFALIIALRTAFWLAVRTVDHPTQPCVPGQSQPHQYLRRNQNNYIIFARKAHCAITVQASRNTLFFQTCLAIVTKKMSEKNFFTLTDKGILVLQERSRRPCRPSGKTTPASDEQIAAEQK